MRVLFFGSSELSIPVLQKLLQSGISVDVFTKEDKPSGRGLKITMNETKRFAIEKGLRVFERWDEIQYYDFMVVAVFGKIIPSYVLQKFKRERRLCVHPSLLPRWRGPAPIQWTLLSDNFGGVSISLVDEKVDSGDIVKQIKVEIGEDDNYLSLSRKLMVLGAELLIEAMNDILSQKANFIKQDESLATWARAIKKEDGRILWEKYPSHYILRMIKAFYPWPKVFTFFQDKRIFIHKAKLAEININANPGDILIDKKRIFVKTVDGWIEILEIQKEGGKVLEGEEFLKGNKLYGSFS